MIEITDEIRKFVNKHVEIKREVWYDARLYKGNEYPDIVKSSAFDLSENCLYSCSLSKYHEDTNAGIDNNKIHIDFFTESWEELVEHIKEHLEKGEI